MLAGLPLWLIALAVGVAGGAVAALLIPPISKRRGLEAAHRAGAVWAGLAHFNASESGQAPVVQRALSVWGRCMAPSSHRTGTGLWEAVSWSLPITSHGSQGCGWDVADRSLGPCSARTSRASRRTSCRPLRFGPSRQRCTRLGVQSTSSSPTRTGCAKRSLTRRPTTPSARTEV